MGLLEDLLSKPVGSDQRKTVKPADYTSEVVLTEHDDGDISVESDDDLDVDAAREFLMERGLNPDEWIATGYQGSAWADKTSAKFTYKYIGKTSSQPLDDLIAAVETYTPGDLGDMLDDVESTYIVALGDMQFGKIDGDGAAGALDRCIRFINEAADRYRHLPNNTHVHIAWLGDHIEGFVSQGGANVWRTPLTLGEQTRLVRRVMMHAALTFAQIAPSVTMVAVPGNHGETTRFSGKGVTRYDDSHDTEALIAVDEALRLRDDLDHVRCYVANTDELVVTVEVPGGVIAHAHGHQWTQGKYMDWWRAQAFHDGKLDNATLLLAGHLHHLRVEQDGKRMFLQVPALESESTWFRHKAGSPGSPGIVVGVFTDGKLSPIEVIND